MTLSSERIFEANTFWGFSASRQERRPGRTGGMRAETEVRRGARRSAPAPGRCDTAQLICAFGPSLRALEPIWRCPGGSWSTFPSRSRGRPDPGSF